MSAERALQRSVLCKEACSAKESALQRSAQRRVLCKEACSAKKRALQRSVLCKEARFAKKRALQRSALCKEACSAKKRALQRSVLCKGACSAKTRKLTGPPSPFTAPEADWPSCLPQNKNRRRTDPTPKLTGPPSPFTARKHVCRASFAKKCALQRSVLCKGQRAAKERAKESALQRSVLCKGECSAKKRALQRSVLCKEARSAKKRALQRSVQRPGSCPPWIQDRVKKLFFPAIRAGGECAAQKNWARKKRMASWARQQQQIMEAADGGARARTGSDGPGAYVLLLSRADGQLTRAGQHYYSHLGLRPPSKDFDYNQPLIREGPNDYILLRNGQKKLVRSLKGGEHRLTKLGKGFFRDKYYEYLVHVAVIIRGRRRSGTPARATSAGTGCR